jgi:transcriptional regulator GlxA family with amidase domain
MALEWALTFSSLSAASAMVQAMRAALEIRKLTREGVKRIAAEAGQAATADEGRAIEAGKEFEAFDEANLDKIPVTYMAG